MRRLLKQLFIALIFFGFWGGVGYLVLQAITPKPVCTDPSNHCGGPSCVPCGSETLLAPPVANTLYFPHAGGNSYDVAAQIKNIYSNWGLRTFNYTFHFLGVSGDEINRVSGQSYIMPGETRWVFVPDVSENQGLSQVTFDIDTSNLDWQKLRPFTQEAGLEARNISFHKVSPPEVGFAKLSGEVYNNSNFFLNDVIVYGILMDKKNNILTIGQTEIKTLQPKESRFFEVDWPDHFLGTVASWQVEPHTNFLLDNNFLDKYKAQ